MRRHESPQDGAPGGDGSTSQDPEKKTVELLEAALEEVDGMTWPDYGSWLAFSALRSRRELALTAGVDVSAFAPVWAGELLAAVVRARKAAAWDLDELHARSSLEPWAVYRALHDAEVYLRRALETL